MVREVLGGAPGVRQGDDVAHNQFPMPREASGQDDGLVGRIRQGVSDPSGWSVALFVAGDRLRKGAALNAVQIAEKLVARNGEMGGFCCPVPPEPRLSLMQRQRAPHCHWHL